MDRQFYGTGEPLEAMYPRIYYRMYPLIAERTDRYFNNYGPFYNPSQEMIGEMVEDIVNNVYYDDEDFGEYRQINPRGLLTTLAGILLIRELVDRRRPHHHRPHHHHYPPYGGYYY